MATRIAGDNFTPGYARESERLVRLARTWCQADRQWQLASVLPDENLVQRIRTRCGQPPDDEVLRKDGVEMSHLVCILAENLGLIVKRKNVSCRRRTTNMRFLLQKYSGLGEVDASTGSLIDVLSLASVLLGELYRHAEMHGPGIQET